MFLSPMKETTVTQNTGDVHRFTLHVKIVLNNSTINYILIATNWNWGVSLSDNIAKLEEFLRKFYYDRLLPDCLFKWIF